MAANIQHAQCFEWRLPLIAMDVSSDVLMFSPIAGLPCRGAGYDLPMKTLTKCIMLGILMGVALIFALPNQMGLGSNERIRMQYSNLAVVSSALKAYAVTHGNRFPATAAEANRVLLSPGAGLLPGDKLLPSPYGGMQRELLPIMGSLGGVAPTHAKWKALPGRPPKRNHPGLGSSRGNPVRCEP